MPENKLIAPSSTQKQELFHIIERCYSVLCLTFEDTIFYKTSSNKFISISNAERPVSSNKCFVQVKNIIVNHLHNYLINDISPCLTCNIFIKDQSFISNLIGKKYNTITYDNVSCGSTNIVYGFTAYTVA